MLVSGFVYFDTEKAGFHRKCSLTSIKSLDEVQRRVPQPRGVSGGKATGDER